jgi:hypothetical protein
MTVPIRTAEPVLVTAKTVATHLGVSITSVYSLVKGVRGWKNIEPLPVKKFGDSEERPRMLFDLNAVVAWVERTQFKKSASGRRKAHNA